MNTTGIEIRQTQCPLCGAVADVIDAWTLVKSCPACGHAMPTLSQIMGRTVRWPADTYTAPFMG